MSATPLTVSSSIEDPTNAAILKISEDQIQGFLRNPIGEIATRAGVPAETVIERLQTMMRTGTIRRVRQTLLATNLANGALVAWNVPTDKLSAAFEYLFNNDPFSGHVVLRSTDAETPGSVYKLWTTLKVPQGFSLEKHAQLLQDKIGAEAFRLMSAKRLFALGVGHLRRRELEIGEKTDAPTVVYNTEILPLTDLEWQVLTTLKREFTPEEISLNLWEARANEAGVDLDTFYAVAESLAERKVIGRFSTFLEHVKPTADNLRVTRYNALFHWRVPVGKELDAGCEVGRFHCMTHAYWREGGPEFANVNVMGVAHGMEKEKVLLHKAAIDAHLESVGIPVLYTNVFWGGRSEIKPSEITPSAYLDFCRSHDVDPEAMREG
jgi:DNA-binding Lrp family transcriptional regulator